MYRTVIFEASEKLRVFGYIRGVNKISVDEFSSNGAYDIKQQTIQNYYSSKVFRNNILDKNQKEIIDTFMRLERKRLLVSAPTSFGKTFILREILFLNQDRYKNILLVFPTIALLNENTENLKDLITSLKSEYKIVNNVYSNINKEDKHIFILTPERTLKLLADRESLTIDFFFFDEVYKIDEDFSVNEDCIDNSKEKTLKMITKVNSENRAKAFRITLYLLAKSITEFYLAGPYLNIQNSKDGLVRFIHEKNITTKQVDFEPTMRIEIDACKKNCVENHPILGEKTISIYNKGNLKTIEKIAGIIEYIDLNNLGQTIFYCSSPANSMKYVREVIESLPNHENKSIIDIKFINHLKHKYGVTIENSISNTAEYWTLVYALENGYGIHHGKFPKYIQKEILRMYNNNCFRHLFCTSTIIEGVNTTAKNVVIINNSVGKNQMTAFTLKNIKGRAGRYYHHYTGRIFYTDKKQRMIEGTKELQLDFPTYNVSKLLDVDLDNAEFEDLSESNQNYKALRNKKLDFVFFPDEIFIKNRLYARDIQENFLKHILKPSEFNKFRSLVDNSSNIRFFLDQKIITKILESFQSSDIIEKNKAIVYHSVVSLYSFKGTNGMIKYHIEQQMKNDNSKKDESISKINYQKTIDQAYINSFDQIRNIVEYEVPKLLCLFEAIFSFAGTKKRIDMSEFSMSSIIRFFELGVMSEFGLSLIEYGFPVDTIKILEKKLNTICDLSTSEAIKYLRKNHKRVTDILDEYELILFAEAIKSFE